MYSFFFILQATDEFTLLVIICTSSSRFACAPLEQNAIHKGTEVQTFLVGFFNETNFFLFLCFGCVLWCLKYLSKLSFYLKCINKAPIFLGLGFTFLGADKNGGIYQDEII